MRCPDFKIVSIPCHHLTFPTSGNRIQKKLGLEGVYRISTAGAWTVVRRDDHRASLGACVIDQQDHAAASKCREALFERGRSRRRLRLNNHRLCKKPAGRKTLKHLAVASHAIFKTNADDFYSVRDTARQCAATTAKADVLFLWLCSERVGVWARWAPWP